MFKRPLDQPGLQGIEIERGGATKLQVGLHLELMIRLGPPPARIQGEHLRINRQLRRHKRDHLGWGRLQVVRDKAEIPEHTQLQGIAQTILGVALMLGFPFIVLRQVEKDDQIVLGHGVGKALPAFPLGLAEKVHRHTALLSRNDPLLSESVDAGVHPVLARFSLSNSRLIKQPLIKSCRPRGDERSCQKEGRNVWAV